jgi:hypothetical protein
MKNFNATLMFSIYSKYKEGRIFYNINMSSTNIVFLNIIHHPVFI